MCFRKTDDDSWPYVATTASTNTTTNLLHEEDDDRIRKRRRRHKQKNATTKIEVEEIEHRRQNVLPNGQCALHIALQMNSSIDVINELLQADPKSLHACDDVGDTPLMTGKTWLLHLHASPFGKKN